MIGRVESPYATDGEAIRASTTRPEAFEHVFTRHYPRVFRYLARRVGADVGSELASEVFAEAFAARTRFRADAEDAGPWLYGIAANLARRQARTWRRSKRAGLRTLGDAVARVDASLEERIDAMGLRESLEDAVSRLKPNDREVLLMYALTDLSYAEVAEALEIPVGTVRSRLSRAREQVATRLGHLGHSVVSDRLRNDPEEGGFDAR